MTEVHAERLAQRGIFSVFFALVTARFRSLLIRFALIVEAMERHFEDAEVLLEATLALTNLAAHGKQNGLNIRDASSRYPHALSIGKTQ